MPGLYDRVAARCASADIPVSTCCIAEIDRYLTEERANDIPQQPLRRLRAQSALGAGASHGDAYTRVAATPRAGKARKIPAGGGL